MITTNATGSQPPVTKKNRDIWFFNIALVLLIVFFTYAGLGKILRLLFPALSFVLAFYYLIKQPVYYVAFCLWIWIASPFVRRLIDQSAGYQDPNIVLLTPYVVTVLSAIALLTEIKGLNSIDKGKYIPYIFCLAAVAYGLLIGLAHGYSLPNIVIDGLKRFTAPLLGAYVLLKWRQYPQFVSTVKSFFLWGTALTSIYGLVQFVAIPGWDALWMRNVDMFSIGTPDPFKVYVFSTMNSPGVFAPYLVAGLLIALNSRNILSIPTLTLGTFVLLLTQVRASWVTFTLGVAILFFSIKAARQMRLIAIALIIILAMIPLINMQGYSDVVLSRLNTFSDIGSDASFNARSSTYAEILPIMATNFLGWGLGSVLSGDFLLDSDFLDIFLNLGWLGGIPYLLGVGMLALSLVRTVVLSSPQNADAKLFATISLSTLAGIVLGIVTAGPIGTVFWLFSSLSAAGNQYHAALQTTLLQNTTSGDSNVFSF